VKPHVFQIYFLPTTALKPYYQNVKTHDRKNVADIANLLARYDFDQPIVVDANNVIIKGHGRYMAALYANRKLVPVIVRDDLTPEQVQASRIADNRVFELGETDFDVVKSELADFVHEGGTGAEALFDFLKTKPAKPTPGEKNKVEVSGTGAPSFKGLMLVCPRCTNTFWEER